MNHRSLITRLRAVELQIGLTDPGVRRLLTPEEIWAGVLALFRWPKLVFAADGSRIIACSSPDPPRRLSTLLTHEWDRRGRPLLILLTVAEIDAIREAHAAGGLCFGQGTSRDYYYTTPARGYHDGRLVELGRALDVAMSNWRRQTQQPCPPPRELEGWLLELRGQLTSGAAFDPVFDRKAGPPLAHA